MKKNKTGKKIVLGILMILVTIGLGTWARYTSSVEGKGSATVAAYASDVTTVEFTTLPTKPGEEVEKTVTISNSKDGKIAQTKLKFWFVLETAGNLPLKLAILETNDSLIDTVNANTKSMEFEFPYSSSTVNKSYKIKVIWPIDQNDAQYAGMVDYVKLKVHIEQATN